VFENNQCCVQHGFLLDRGLATIIDVPFTGAKGTIATDINDRGEIVGAYVDNQGRLHGFALEQGVFQSVDVPFPGAFDTGMNGIAINNSGKIVGTYNSVTGVQGFAYQRNVFTHLNTPRGTSRNGTFVNGINDRGQIVGCVDGLAFQSKENVFLPLYIPFPRACPYQMNNIGELVGAFNGFDGFIRR
jgi:uncharacterized membrane protein